MLLVGLQGFLLVLFKILILIFQQNTVEACPGTVITACNDTSSCIQTYEKVYNLLGSHQNYFNIAQALYPKKWLPSRLVHVTLYGANGQKIAVQLNTHGVYLACLLHFLIMSSKFYPLVQFLWSLGQITWVLQLTHSVVMCHRRIVWQWLTLCWQG